MAEETLAEAPSETVEHITPENMDSTANLKDATKPHDPSIPEPDRDPTKPDDPTAQHESAHHHKAGHGPGAANEASQDPGAAGGPQPGADGTASDDKGPKGHAGGRAAGDDAGPKGHAGAGPNPHMDDEQKKLAMDVFEQSLKTTDWGWQNKTGKERELGHQSFVHMERSFIIAAKGDRQAASDLYHKVAGKPPSEALMKRVDDMSATNFSEALNDLNHGVNRIASKTEKHGLEQERRDAKKLVDEWKKGVDEAEHTSKQHRKRAMEEMLKTHGHHDPHKEHGQFIIKGAWKSLGAGGDMRKSIGEKYRKLKIGFQHHVEKGNLKKIDKGLGQIAKDEKRFSLHTTSDNPLNRKSGKPFEASANDNEKVETPQAARTTGMSGKAADKFQGVRRGIEAAQATARLAREAGRAMKRGVEAVGNGLNRMMGRDGPQQTAAPEAAVKVDMGSPEASRPSPDAAVNAARQAAQARNQGMGM